MRNFIKTCGLAVSGTIVGIGSVGTALATPPTYRVDVIPGLAELPWNIGYPNALSNAGKAVGYVSAPGEAVRGWSWDGSSLQMLTPPSGLDGATFASDVNELGEILGWIDVDGVGMPAVWKGETLQQLPRLNLGEYTSAYGMNDVGGVVGASVTTGLLWEDGEVSPVAPVPGTQRAHPMHINNAGVMAGLAAIDGRSFPARWVDGVGEFLPVPAAPQGESWFAYNVNDMNDHGDVVGASFIIGAAARGYMWHDGQPVDIGEFDLSNPTITLPSGINNARWVVGIQYDTAGAPTTFLWIDGVMHELSSLLAPEFADFELLTANSINDSGVITATAWTNGGQFPVLLTPVPAPGAIAVLAVAMATLAARRRNQ